MDHVFAFPSHVIVDGPSTQVFQWSCLSARSSREWRKEMHFPITRADSRGVAIRSCRYTQNIVFCSFINHFRWTIQSQWKPTYFTKGCVEDITEHSNEKSTTFTCHRKWWSRSGCLYWWPPTEHMNHYRHRRRFSVAQEVYEHTVWGVHR